MRDIQGCNNPSYKHGLRQHKLFGVWTNMKTRCYNPNNEYYRRYGGRGITICEQWLSSFKVFYDWSMKNGYVDGLTIDRINNDGNYEPSNCRWATRKVQSLNTSTNAIFEINGQAKPLSMWCDEFNISCKSVRSRLSRNWTIERALTTPVDTKYRRKLL